MPTCIDVAKRSLRRLNVIDAIADPAPEDASVALEGLQGLIDRYVTAASGNLTEVYATSDITAGENQRIRRSAAETITYPGRIDGHRDPYDGSLVIVTGQPRLSRIYDADLGLWTVLSGLLPTDECPLAARDPGAVSAALAIEIADIFGKTPLPLTIRDGMRGRLMLSDRIGGRHLPEKASAF